MMSKFGILLALIALTAMTANGMPRKRLEMEVKRRDILTNKQIAEMKLVRPCYARLAETRKEIFLHEDITSEPHYIPQCTEDGKKWKPAQCGHDDGGSCFCVHEDNGDILNHTRSSQFNRESLSCGIESRAANADHSSHECFHMQDEFNHMQDTYGLEDHAPLFYYPECTAKGTFMALQRNDRSFFCVDTATGDVIPETTTQAGSIPPLTEHICAAYDKVWREFQEWKKSRNIEEDQRKSDAAAVVTKESCKAGQTFTECGCAVKCTAYTSIQNVKKSCKCKPACVCPQGRYDLDGKCVTLEECNEAKPPSEVPQADKLDELTNGLWSEYRRKNPNAILESYNSMGMEEVRNAGGGPVAFDINPNVQAFMAQPPPEEEMGMGSRVGAEGIPGNNSPYLRQILNEIGNPGPEEEHILEELFPDQFPPEEETTEREFEPESNSNGEEVREFFNEEELEENQEEVEQLETEEPWWNPEEEEILYYGEENNEEPVPEEETATEEFYEPKEEEPSEEPEIEEEITENEESQYHQNEQESYEESEEPLHHQNEEEIEEENVVDERLNEEVDNSNEETIAHQTEQGEISSVPTMSPEEIQQHDAPSTQTPCAETEAESIESESPLDHIERVLAENRVLEATFEKPTQSVKKNNAG